jgi:hypothetical protein
LNEFSCKMNSNHTITMNSQQLQRRPYSRGAISRNMNHNRMQRMQPFSSQQNQQQQRNNNGSNNPNNGNKDILEYSHG